MERLRVRFGNKMGVIIAHKNWLYGGGEAKESTEGFSKLSNELSCFQAVAKLYNSEVTLFSDDMVKTILKNKLSFKHRESVYKLPSL